jgi:hypothetical protein
MLGFHTEVHSDADRGGGGGVSGIAGGEEAKGTRRRDAQGGGGAGKRGEEGLAGETGGGEGDAEGQERKGGGEVINWGKSWSDEKLSGQERRGVGSGEGEVGGGGGHDGQGRLAGRALRLYGEWCLRDWRKRLVVRRLRVYVCACIFIAASAWWCGACVRYLALLGLASLGLAWICCAFCVWFRSSRRVFCCVCSCVCVPCGCVVCGCECNVRALWCYQRCLLVCFDLVLPRLASPPSSPCLLPIPRALLSPVPSSHTSLPIPDVSPKLETLNPNF